MPARQDRRLVRTGDHWLHLPNPYGVPAEICAGDDVPLEHAAVDEALALLETARTLERLAEATPGYDGPEPRIARVALTPDFHKGAGIPIGTVLETEHALLPQAVRAIANNEATRRDFFMITSFYGRRQANE